MKKFENKEYKDKIAEKFIDQYQIPQNSQFPNLKVEAQQPQKDLQNANVNENNQNTGVAQSPTR